MNKNWAIHPPLAVQRLMPDLLWQVATPEKVLYLTFDDGPVPEVSLPVLEILRGYQARATFFCVGENVLRNPAIYRQILSEGHGVGNHTFSHINGWKNSVQRYVADVSRAEKLIDSRIFRPPYGKLRIRQKNRLKADYRIVMWDVLSRDYDSELSGIQCVNNVLYHAKLGSIVVFHDSLKAKKNVLFALPKVLKHFSERGYRFLPLPLDF